MAFFLGECRHQPNQPTDQVLDSKMKWVCTKGVQDDSCQDGRVVLQ